jgi:copper chaperone CopZ
MTTHELRIEGMSCQHCVKSVREALTRVPGVTQVSVEIGHASVRTTDDVPRTALVAALAAVDYPAS